MGETMSPNGERVYYAHYLGQDNRLDEWVNEDRLQRQISSEDLE